MKLQQLILRDVARENILLPLYETEEEIRKRRFTTQDLYARLKDASFMEKGAEGIYFREEGTAKFDTYQNCFSSGKWAKYTIFEEVALCLELEGEFEITLYHAEIDETKKKEPIVETELSTKTISAKERQTIKIDFGKLKDEGIFYFELEALSDGAMLYSGYYEVADLKPTQPVKLAIDICTFKREQYVRRNMNILKNDILENENSPLYGKLWVHISDNASSLDGIVDSEEHITVDKNTNLGGVGGFTRGIIETQKIAKEKGLTHVLIMDDDATISSAAVEANYLLLSYLKPEYFGHTIGGKLLVLNAPFVQFEVGAQWNAGDIKALKSEKDIRIPYEVIMSEKEDEEVEYQGWWYCCIPLSEIDEDNLPLPIFIHRDDVEYGLRTGRGRFIFMNRICIWHEAFAGKMPGFLDYYDIRNHCITNAIQCPEYTKKEFKKYFSKWVWRNISKYRYKYIDYNIKAVEDFCKGIDFLLEKDGGELAQELFAMNYKMQPLKEFVGMDGLTELELKEREYGFKNPCFLVRQFHKYTANGYFFPAKGGKKIVVTDPYGNIHRLYRRKRTVVVDNYGNALYLERDRKQFWECRKRLKKALKLIDEKYDEAAKSYHDRYGELVSRKFWEKYLGI